MAPLEKKAWGLTLAHLAVSITYYGTAILLLAAYAINRAEALQGLSGFTDKPPETHFHWNPVSPFVHDYIGLAYFVTMTVAHFAVRNPRIDEEKESRAESYLSGLLWCIGGLLFMVTALILTDLQRYRRSDEFAYMALIPFVVLIANILTYQWPLRAHHIIQRISWTIVLALFGLGVANYALAIAGIWDDILITRHTSHHGVGYRVPDYRWIVFTVLALLAAGWFFSKYLQQRPGIGGVALAIGSGVLYFAVMTIDEHVDPIYVSWPFSGRPLGDLFTLTALVTGIGVVHQRVALAWMEHRHVMEASNLCRQCGYDLTGTLRSGRSQCPECGAAAPVYQVARFGEQDAAR